VSLLACVPNVSEGRRPERIRRFAEAVRSVTSVQLLDVSSDPDHNRSVLTLAGSSQGLITALLALFEVALADIDLGTHEGVHPRVGAVDVVPFVPLQESSMAEAVQAARRLGRRVASSFGVPVYFYEAAATVPGRRNLAALRSSKRFAPGCEIREREWLPDFGPSRVHPTAGVTLIGARSFLVAFNVLLDTANLELAREVAAAVRESNGGLPAVKAMGVLLPTRGCAQVSMNLVDYRQTSPVRALRRVKEEARARGCQVVASEIVGLIPSDAVSHSMNECLQLENDVGRQILEDKLRRPDL
jgi:glutamate formiminotransferase